MSTISDPLIHVTIKGDKFQAAAAASMRNIPLAHDYDARDLSHGFVAGHYIEDVMRWFTEPATAPFPVGTCMYYSVNESRR